MGPTKVLYKCKMRKKIEKKNKHAFKPISSAAKNYSKERKEWPFQRRTCITQRCSTRHRFCLNKRFVGLHPWSTEAWENKYAHTEAARLKRETTSEEIQWNAHHPATRTV